MFITHMEVLDNLEKTFVMVKPDGVARGLVGEVIKRFEQKGFRMLAGKLMVMSLEQAQYHYAEHKGKYFYDNLISFITSGPVFPMVWQGEQVIALSRLIIGKTNVLEALPGTIRGDYGTLTNRNVIHGADSVESAKREMLNLFTPEEILTS